MAGCAVWEDDRHLDDPEPGAGSKGIHFHLEAKAASLQEVEIDALQHLPAEALEAAGAVPDRQFEEGSSVEAATSTYQTAQHRPVLGSPPRNIAGADHHVCVLSRPQQTWQILRPMGEVGIHLDDELVVVGQRVLEAFHVSSGESLLAPALYHPHPARLPGKRLGQRSGAIRRPVIDDEDVKFAVCSQDFKDQAREVLTLVVGWDYD